MDTKLEQKIIQTAVAGYGIQHQTVKTMEELGELMTELARNLGGRDNRYAMAGEIIKAYAKKQKQEALLI